MNHPAKHFIYYLLSKRSLTIDGILEVIDDYGLGIPTENDQRRHFKKQLSKYKKKLVIPPGFKPKNPNPETDEFLQKWGLVDIWENTRYMRAARNLLENPGPRRMISVLLLSALNIKTISDRTRDRFSMSHKDMNPRVVRLFSHYFWNYDALDRDEWARYLISWVPGRTDDMVTALKAPRTAGGLALALNAADQAGAGETPSVLIYSAAREYGFRMFMNHALGTPHPGNTLGALQSLDIIIKADTELDKRRGGSAELLEQFDRLEAEYAKPSIPSLDEIPQLVAEKVDVIDVTSEENTDT